MFNGLPFPSVTLGLVAVEALGPALPPAPDPDPDAKAAPKADEEGPGPAITELLTGPGEPRIDEVSALVT